MNNLFKNNNLLIFYLVSVEFSYCSWVVRQPFHDQRATRTTTSMS